MYQFYCSLLYDLVNWDMIYLKFVAIDFFLRINNTSTAENCGDTVQHYVTKVFVCTVTLPDDLADFKT